MDLLNAMNFGAVGDGSTDDTHALQTAINHAAAMHELLLDLGEHDENVVVKDNIGTLVTEKTNRDAFLGEVVEDPGGFYQ